MRYGGRKKRSGSHKPEGFAPLPGGVQREEMSVKTHQTMNKKELSQETYNPDLYVKASSGTGKSPVVMLDDLSFAFQRLVEIILRFKAMFFV